MEGWDERAKEGIETGGEKRTRGRKEANSCWRGRRRKSNRGQGRKDGKKIEEAGGQGIIKGRKKAKLSEERLMYTYPSRQRQGKTHRE